MQTGNDHGINSAVQGSQICHCEGASRPWQSREGSHDFADSLPGIRLSSARLPRRFAPRNDKSEAFAILTVACTDCKCVAGPGCPLPYNGGCDQRDCLPEIAPQGHFLALRAQGATSAVGLLAMAKQEAFRILHSSFFSLQDSFISVPRPYSELPGKAQKKLRSFDRSFMLALPIFPCSHPQSIVGANELNFCVRDGNRCTLTAINTNYSGTHPEN